MKAAEEIGTLRRVASARMPTKWGMFNAAGFARRAPNGIQPHPPCVRRELNLIKRRADYVNH